MKYIAFYDTLEYAFENRSVALCAKNVIDYIIEVLPSSEPIEIVSPSRTRNKTGIYRGRKNKLSSNAWLIQPFSFGVHTAIGRAIAVMWTQIWLLLYLLFNTSKDEYVMDYHSASTMTAIALAKKIKRFKLIIEVREIYSDARKAYDEFSGRMDRLHKKEMKFFKIADKYVFPTELLNEIVNTEHKPYVVAPGIYKTELQSAALKWNDDKIHLIYAGTLRGAKGAFLAIDVAKHLSRQYQIHILGSGTEENVAEIKKRISENSGLDCAEVRFEGQLRGEEFISYLQKCHIGLAPQDPEAAFTNTSFPSKILTYFSNGLEVVSIRIPAVEKSPVGKYIYFYDKANSSDLANAIKSVDLKNGVNKSGILNQLDSELKKKMKELIDD